MCNVFKPDRCHHCSACNRCVLNMDHHCPWVNNCVGFWNRKFFVLLLLYALCSLYFYVATMFTTFYGTIKYHIDSYGKPVNWRELAYICLLDVSYLFSTFLAFVMTKFFIFHLTLISYNMTTIESLEHKGIDYKSLVLIEY